MAAEHEGISIANYQIVMAIDINPQESVGGYSVPEERAVYVGNYSSWKTLLGAAQWKMIALWIDVVFRRERRYVSIAIMASSRRYTPPLVVALALAVWSVSARAMSQQSAPVFRGNVELFTVRVHVTAGRGQPLPELDSTAFSIRIGSRTPLVRFAEHVVIPTEAERAGGPFAFFKPVPNQLSALYVVGVEASAAYCGKTPKVRVAPKGLKVRGLAWTPGRGCEPPGARIIKESLRKNEDPRSD